MLAGRVDVLYAVDPSPNMLAQLADAVPQAITAVGAAEAIPLPDGCVDAVLVAQAWHWVDPARALPAVRRVLAPRGVLGLIWNVRDESVPWVAELTRIIHGSEAERFVANDQPLPTELGPIERLVVRWGASVRPPVAARAGGLAQLCDFGAARRASSHHAWGGRPARQPPSPARRSELAAALPHRGVPHSPRLGNRPAVG